MKSLYLLYVETKLNHENAHEKIYKINQCFLKEVRNHCYAIALHFVYYNFVKIHKSFRVPPAMQAGLIKRLMSIEDIANLVKDVAPQKRGSYKKMEKE